MCASAHVCVSAHVCKCAYVCVCVHACMHACVASVNVLRTYLCATNYYLLQFDSVLCFCVLLHACLPSCADVNSNLLRDPGAEVSSSGDSPWEYQTREMTAQKAMKTNVDGGLCVEGMGGSAMGVVGGGGRERGEKYTYIVWKLVSGRSEVVLNEVKSGVCCTYVLQLSMQYLS